MTRLPRIARAAALLAALALSAGACEFNGAYDLPLPGSPVDEDHSFEVSAEFQDILNVVPRSPVMVDDVTVGEVTSVKRVGWHAAIPTCSSCGRSGYDRRLDHKSRMGREFHVRFCEGLGVKFPRATRPSHLEHRH